MTRLGHTSLYCKEIMYFCKYEYENPHAGWLPPVLSLRQTSRLGLELPWSWDEHWPGLRVHEGRASSPTRHPSSSASHWTRTPTPWVRATTSKVRSPASRCRVRTPATNCWVRTPVAEIWTGSAVDHWFKFNHPDKQIVQVYNNYLLLLYRDVKENLLYRGIWNQFYLIKNILSVGRTNNTYNWARWVGNIYFFHVYVGDHMALDVNVILIG